MAIVVKHEKLNTIVGKLPNNDSNIQPGDILCDIANKVNYEVSQRVIDIASGAVIGFLVNGTRQHN